MYDHTNGCGHTTEGHTEWQTRNFLIPEKEQPEPQLHRSKANVGRGCHAVEGGDGTEALLPCPALPMALHPLTLPPHCPWEVRL
jgi:hypothetical protein